MKRTNGTCHRVDESHNLGEFREHTNAFRYLLATRFLSLPSSSTSISSLCWLPTFWLCTVLNPKLLVLLVRLRAAAPSPTEGLGVAGEPNAPEVGSIIIIIAWRLLTPAPMTTGSKGEGPAGSGNAAAVGVAGAAPPEVGTIDDGMLED